MEPSTQQSLNLLRDSLVEAQATVRAYDTKAQIVGIGYIFALRIIGQVRDLIPSSTSELNIVGVLIVWGVVILPILLFGFVLYPSRKMAPELADETTVKVEHILYVDPKNVGGVEDLKKAVSRCDPIDEAAFELLKVTGLRELKRQRFLRALFAAGICFVLLFAKHIILTF